MEKVKLQLTEKQAQEMIFSYCKKIISDGSDITVYDKNRENIVGYGADIGHFQFMVDMNKDRILLVHSYKLCSRANYIEFKITDDLVRLQLLQEIIDKELNWD